ncbi:MAG: hypothetical protein IB618_03595 [Candidatus Pacearchaeota archaeon]|nr:MAG: hypothetical protein IB618_03595 [Candidatus Pacearchaeota archaeon]
MGITKGMLSKYHQNKEKIDLEIRDIRNEINMHGTGILYEEDREIEEAVKLLTEKHYDNSKSIDGKVD